MSSGLKAYLLFKPSNRRLMPLLKIFGESPMLPKEVAGVSGSFVSREILEAKDETVSWVDFCEAFLSWLRESAGDASENTDNLFRFLGDGEWAGVSAKAATAS